MIVLEDTHTYQVKPAVPLKKPSDGTWLDGSFSSEGVAKKVLPDKQPQTSGKN